MDLLEQGKTNRVVGFKHGEYVDFDIDEALGIQKGIRHTSMRSQRNLHYRNSMRKKALDESESNAFYNTTIVKDFIWKRGYERISERPYASRQGDTVNVTIQERP